MALRPSGPLVSLVMPVWQPTPEWLREAVASALGQEGCEIEVLVVDDGSDPPVEDLLEGLDDDRLHLLRLSHGGVSRARNAGTAAAKGAFLRYVDCDDVLPPRGTAHLLTWALQHPGSIAYGATLICDERLRGIGRESSSLRGDVSEACLLDRFSVTIHSLLFPRDVVAAAGEWDETFPVSQDWEFVLRALEHASVTGDDYVVTWYRTHAKMNSRDLAAGLDAYRRILDGYFERHPQRRGTPLERRARARYHAFAVSQLSRRRGETLESPLPHVRELLRLDPLAAPRTVAGAGVRALAAAVRSRRISGA